MGNTQSRARKKRQFLLAFIFLCGFSLVFAKEYEKAVGLRGGLTSKITYKKFLNDIKAMEAMISFRVNGPHINALRKHHQITFLEFEMGFTLYRVMAVTVKYFLNPSYCPSSRCIYPYPYSWEPEE